MLTLSQKLFSFVCCPASDWDVGAQGARRGQNQDSWPELDNEIFHTIWCHAEL